MIDVHGKGFARLLWGVCLLALANPVQVHADNQYPPIVPIGAMEPFECDGRIFIAENIFDGVGDISGVDLGTINLTEPPLLKLDLIPSSHRDGYTYNAMGYNPIDNFIYAIKRDNNGADSHDLLRIDRNGNVEYVISLGEFTESVVADFDDEGNFYIVDYDYRLFKYRIDGNNVELVDSKPLNPPVPLQDMGYYDGALWSIQVNNQNYSIVRIDLDDFGAVTAGPFQSGTGETLSFTSVFAAKNGVYAYDTDSGNFVRIDMSSGDISQMSLQFLAKGTEMSSSDGAKCLHAPPRSAGGHRGHENTRSGCISTGPVGIVHDRREEQWPLGRCGHSACRRASAQCGQRFLVLYFENVGGNLRPGERHGRSQRDHHASAIRGLSHLSSDHRDKPH